MTQIYLEGFGCWVRLRILSGVLMEWFEEHMLFGGSRSHILKRLIQLLYPLEVKESGTRKSPPMYNCMQVSPCSSVPKILEIDQYESPVHGEGKEPMFESHWTLVRQHNLLLPWETTLLEGVKGKDEELINELEEMWRHGQCNWMITSGLHIYLLNSFTAQRGEYVRYVLLLLPPWIWTQKLAIFE